MVDLLASPLNLAGQVTALRTTLAKLGHPGAPADKLDLGTS